MIEVHYFSQTVCIHATGLLHVLSMLFKNCKKKTFLLLAETMIIQTTLRSYLKVVNRKIVSMVSNES